MPQGYIKLHRKILEWEWWDDANTCRLFFYLLLSANHSDRMYKGKLIPRGSLLAGREVLSKATGISPQSIRSSIKRLKSTSEITIKSTNRGSHIFIVNWAKYQGDDSESTSTSTSKSTFNQPATNQQLTTNKNVKNVKNKENDLLRKSQKKKISFDWLEKYPILKNDDLRNVLSEFKIYRKKQRKPLTEYSTKLVINKLITLAGTDIQAMIQLLNTAMERGWMTVFAERENNIIQPKSSLQRKLEDDMKFNEARRMAILNEQQ